MCVRIFRPRIIKTRNAYGREGLEGLEPRLPQSRCPPWIHNPASARANCTSIGLTSSDGAPPARVSIITGCAGCSWSRCASCRVIHRLASCRPRYNSCSRSHRTTCSSKPSATVVSSPDPFPYAHAREIIGGWRKSEGKGLANRVGLARATVGMLARLEWNAS